MCLPDAWKSDVVKPLFKTQSKLDPGNYRPVGLSLTCVQCVNMEDIICDYVADKLINCEFVNSRHGFMRGRSSNTKPAYCFQMLLT